jgi:ornithine carbamoyltransferase
VHDVDAVYTDLWVSMGNSDHERPARSAVLAPYRVDEALMALAAPHAVFLHCLPANRSEEVAAEVLDGPQSIVFAQAANRLPTGQAILYAAVAGELTGAASDVAAER